MRLHAECLKIAFDFTAPARPAECLTRFETSYKTARGASAELGNARFQERRAERGMFTPCERAIPSRQILDRSLNMQKGPVTSKLAAEGKLRLWKQGRNRQRVGIRLNRAPPHDIALPMEGHTGCIFRR